MRLLRKHQQRGVAAVMVALALVPMLAGIGLAIDAGMGYIVRGKLNAALDSAGIAAARALTKGTDPASQESYARRAAHDFFEENYRDYEFGSQPTLDEPRVSFDNGKVTIDLSATATVPTSFMRLMGFNQLTVAGTAQTVRKDLDMALVMDTSGSLSGVASSVRASAVTFLNQFSPTTDRVALVHFAYGGVVDNAIRTTTRGFDRPALIQNVNNFGFSGSTNSGEGLWNARDQLNSIVSVNRSSLRVIVFFSDGSPNSFSSYFPFRAGYSCTSAGTITTGDGTSAAEPRGLYRIDSINTALSGQCNGGSSIRNRISALPDWYNAHNPASNPNNPALREFPIVTNAPRVVTADVSSRTTAWRNINRASRNLVEAIAAKARDEGVFVFTLGLGAELRDVNGPDLEHGEDLLKCLANVPDAPARCYNPAKPVGLYCYAATENDLKPCFSRLASEILRLTR